MIKIIYLFFALVHPITELLSRTNLRLFLNGIYYATGRNDFPVSKFRGVSGSLLVLALLAMALLKERWLGVDWWCLAVGLVIADLIQHAAHLISRPSAAAPRIHLVTILGAAICLPWIRQGGALEQPICYLSAAAGALIIFGNWAFNSLRALKTAT